MHFKVQNFEAASREGALNSSLPSFAYMFNCPVSSASRSSAVASKSSARSWFASWVLGLFLPGGSFLDAGHATRLFVEVKVRLLDARALQLPVSK